jgi:hypothetical protein
MIIPGMDSLRQKAALVVAILGSEVGRRERAESRRVGIHSRSSHEWGNDFGERSFETDTRLIVHGVQKVRSPVAEFSRI